MATTLYRKNEHLYIYIATKFENAERAKEVADQLEAAGHVITYKWWLNDQVTADQAMTDFLGVTRADAMVLIVEEDYRYSGALTEFGIAIGRNIPVYILGNQLDLEPRGASPNIFVLLPDVYRGIEPLLSSSPTLIK